MNINGGGQIIATTTLTMDLGHVNAKSVIKTHQKQIPEVLSSNSNHLFYYSSSLFQSSIFFLFLGSVESISSNESEKEQKLENNNNFNTKVNKEHNFVQKIIVIPEICDQCHKKFV